MKLFPKISLLVLMFIVLSCKDYTYSGDPKIIVTITDAPSSKFTSLVTSVENVEIYDGSKWISIGGGSTGNFDLLSLSGGEELRVADCVLDDNCQYSKIKVTFGEENFLSVYQEEQTYELVSEQENLQWIADIKLAPEADQIIALAIDVDVEKSVTYDEIEDEYMFNPSNGCGIIDVMGSGAVSGMIVNTSKNILTSKVLAQIESVNSGAIIRSTYSNEQEGTFFCRLDSGYYNITFVPCQDEAYDTVVISNVYVENEKVTSLGNVIFGKKNE